MFAVAAYLLPTEYTDTVGRTMKIMNRLSAPYVLSLSQWQKWDIFSPDPLRRVTDFRIESRVVDVWRTERVFTYDTLSWHERAKELKVLGRLEYGWERLIPSYLSAACRELGIGSSEVRLVAEYWILPMNLRSLRKVSSSKFERTTRILGSTYCRT